MTVWPFKLVRRNKIAARTPPINGGEYIGSMMKIADHMTGGVGNGQNIWVP